MNHMVPPHMLDALDRRIAMDRDKARVDHKSRMLRIERHAHGVGLCAMMLNASDLPEYHDAEMHAHFESLAGLLGYTVTKGTEQ